MHTLSFFDSEHIFFVLIVLQLKLNFAYYFE